MALFKILRGNAVDLPTEIKDGYAYFCTDTHDFYIDYTNNENELTRGLITAGSSNNSRPNRLGFLGIDFINNKIQDGWLTSTYSTDGGVTSANIGVSKVSLFNLCTKLRGSVPLNTLNTQYRRTIAFNTGIYEGDCQFDIDTIRIDISNPGGHTIKCLVEIGNEDGTEWKHAKEYVLSGAEYAPNYLPYSYLNFGADYERIRFTFRYDKINSAMTQKANIRAIGLYGDYYNTSMPTFSSKYGVPFQVDYRGITEFEGALIANGNIAGSTGEFSGPVYVDGVDDDGLSISATGSILASEGLLSDRHISAAGTITTISDQAMSIDLSNIFPNSTFEGKPMTGEVDAGVYSQDSGWVLSETGVAAPGILTDVLVLSDDGQLCNYGTTTLIGDVGIQGALTGTSGYFDASIYTPSLSSDVLSTNFISLERNPVNNVYLSNQGYVQASVYMEAPEFRGTATKSETINWHYFDANGIIS